MIWTIIGILILGTIWSMASQGRQKLREERKKDREKNLKVRRFQKRIKRDPDLLKKQWKIRIKELDIDLSDAVRVKYYYNYYHINEPDTEHYAHCYIWPEEGAIGRFDDYKGMSKGLKWSVSPLEWDIYYIDLSKIRGVYKRRETIIQYTDGSVSCFPLEDYEKVKSIYKKAKEMTE